MKRTMKKLPVPYVSILAEYSEITVILTMTQVQEGFIVDEDEEVEDRSQRRQEKKKRRREEREREEEHLDEEDLELIGEHNPSLQPPVAAEVCRTLILIPLDAPQDNKQQNLTREIVTTVQI